MNDLTSSRRTLETIGAELVVGLDQIPLRAGPGGLRSRRIDTRGRNLVLAAGTAAAALLVIATLRLGADSGSQTGLPQASSSPSAAAVASASPKADATASPTPAGTVAPQLLRVQWSYLSDRGVLVFEDELVKVQEVRIVMTSGAVVGSATARAPEPGEPRTCGHPNVIKPQVAVLPVSAAVSRDFADGSATGPSTRLTAHRVEVRQADGVWHALDADQLLARSKLAGAPCYQ